MFFSSNYLLKNTKSLAALGGRGRNIPDAVTRTALHEIKNAIRLKADDQLRAFARFCKATDRKLVIHVRPGTTIDGTVQRDLNALLGEGSRGKAWDIVTDVPEEMRIMTGL